MSGGSLHPPKWADRLLTLVCKSEVLDYLQGDLYEVYYDRLEKHGKRTADRMFVSDVFQSLRPRLMRPFEGSDKLNSYGMYKNYFKVIIRNLLKHKVFSSINILSLSIGMAACLVIFLFIKDELSFDGFHTKKDNIYRLCELQTWEGTNPQNVPITWPKMGYEMPNYFPEVESYTRFWPWGEDLWINGDIRLLVEKQAAVDSTFLNVFDFELVSGDRMEALSEPNSVLIDEQLAMGFFHSVDVVGKTLTKNGESFEITGVLKNIPENSHLQFDMLISLANVIADQPDFNQRTGSNFLNTYLVLNEKANIEAMEDKFPAFLSSLVDDEDINEAYKLFLQRLEDVHLASNDIEHDYQNHRKFNGTYIDVFILTSVFIMIIACVNFMNLTAARSNTRSKEVGVRKSIGAQRVQLVYQFILESILMSVLALFLALIADFLLLPFLNELISRELNLLTILSDVDLLPLIFAGTVFLGLISGLYPSLYLASFKVVRALKGIDKTNKKSVFRSSLVVVQFSLALAMIVCTLIVTQQLMYMSDKDIGFDKDHILLVKLNKKANDNYKAMKETLQAESVIIGVTGSGQRLGNNFHQWGFQYKKDTTIRQVTPSHVVVDYNYLDVYGIKLKSGRTFSESYAKDDGLAFIINESFAKELGYDEPLGQSVGYGWYPKDSLGTIIGVTEDFNFNSLHFEVNTLSLAVHTEWGLSEMSVKLDRHNVAAGIERVEAVWNEYVPDVPFKYEFLDEHFDEVYKSDQQMGAVILIMAMLSILIGCMGLFGLASISIERRIKEIGIRKVLGASTSQLLVLLSRSFAILMGVSFVVATPITYLYMQDWLSNFAFRITINPFIFLLGGILAFVIAMLTISIHTLKASSANPVESLRDE
ncbi:MAG: ABC transporter permease [Cyclobacteriaceae bacterium]